MVYGIIKRNWRQSQYFGYSDTVSVLWCFDDLDVVFIYVFIIRTQVGLPNYSYKPLTNTEWVRARLSKLQQGCTRLATANDKVYQLLAYGRWFSPGTPASSTTKTGRHDIAEILLKVALIIYIIEIDNNNIP